MNAFENVLDRLGLSTNKKRHGTYHKQPQTTSELLRAQDSAKTAQLSAAGFGVKGACIATQVAATQGLLHRGC